MTIHSWEHFSSFDAKLRILIERAFGGYVIKLYILVAILPFPIALIISTIGKLIGIATSFESIFVTVCLLPLALLIPVFSVILFSKYILWSLKSQKKYFSQTINYYENLEEIIYKLKGIGSTLRRVATFLNFLRHGIKHEDFQDISQSLYEEMQFFISFMQDLRSDLQLRLTEQQKTLEQAKSEVEQNIHGTTELEQVSELQKARFDRQIEQFEELQKVLMKV